MRLPSAMPTARSIVFRCAIATAEPLSAAPPTMARQTIPMKAADIPSAVAVLSRRADENLAHPRREQGGGEEPTDGPPEAPARGVVGLLVAGFSGALVRVGREHEHQIARVSGEQRDGETDVEQSFPLAGAPRGR